MMLVGLVNGMEVYVVSLRTVATVKAGGLERSGKEVAFKERLEKREIAID
jgi:hypothetical protein